MIFTYLFQAIIGLIDDTMNMLTNEIKKATELQNNINVYATPSGHYIRELYRLAKEAYERLSLYMNMISHICKLLKDDQEYGYGHNYSLKIIKTSYDHFHHVYEAFKLDPLTETYKIDAVIMTLCSCYMQSIDEFEKTNSQIPIRQSDVAIMISCLNSLCRNGLPQTTTFRVDTDIDTSYNTHVKDSSNMSAELFIPDLELKDGEIAPILPVSNTDYDTSLPSLPDLSSLPDIGDSDSDESDKENNLRDLEQLATRIGNPHYLFDIVKTRNILECNERYNIVDMSQLSDTSDTDLDLIAID